MMNLPENASSRTHAMTLRVWAGTDFAEVPLHGGLTIGRCDDEDLCIEGRDVAWRHAFVLAEGDQFTLRARDGEVIWLPDGNQTQVLILTRGVCFGIGEAVLQCWEREEPAAPPHPTPVLAAEPARCRRCSADVSRVPAGARYCPRCGIVLALPRAPWDVPAHLDPFSDEMPPPPFDPNQPVRSQMIFGYAAAMHNLGVRYEEGRRGTPRNLQEAVRCYVKSARLGNDGALDRLTGR